MRLAWVCSVLLSHPASKRHSTRLHSTRQVAAWALNCGRCAHVLKLNACYASARCSLPCRFKIEQELGTEIKPIPAHIEEKLYCV